MEALGRFFEQLNDTAPMEAVNEKRKNTIDKEAQDATRILRQRGLLKSASGGGSPLATEQ